MNVRFIDGNTAEGELLWLTEHCDEMSWAVAWATPNAVVEAGLKHSAKFRHLVIGTHMYQTSPDVLEKLAGVDAARVMPPTGALFHPKVYSFTIGTQVVAVVGSHNLTLAAFERNVEASLLMDGQSTAPEFVDLRAFLTREWKRAACLDESFLYSYRIQHARKRDASESLRRFVFVKKPLRSDNSPAPLEMSWSELVRQVKRDRNHSLAGRLDILESAQKLFAAHTSLVAMSKEDRKRIAGTEGRQERARQRLDWGWFGAMSGFGGFSHLVIEEPQKLSAALDEIPLTGPVAPAHYVAYLERFKAAFAGMPRKGSISSGTRLLALKRPDYFVCFNNANKRRLCERFGRPASSVSLDNYWDAIVEPIILSPWWNETRPKDSLQGRIWDGRTAMLDAIYYEPIK